MLKYIEDTLLKNWNGYGGFEELQEKILRLRMILEETDGKATAQGDGYSTHYWKFKFNYVYPKPI